MSSITSKCPKCNCEIQLDGSQEFGICKNCGNKVIVNEVPSYNVDNMDSLMLEELCEHAIQSTMTANPSELQELSSRILEIDPDCWKGWFCRGVAEARLSHNEEMYRCWTNALKNMSDEEYLEHEHGFVKFATIGLISYGVCAGITNALPIDFLALSNSKSVEGRDRFAVQVLNNIKNLSYMIDGQSALAVAINGGLLVRAELYIFCDITAIMASLKSYLQVISMICSDEEISGSFEDEYALEMFNIEYFPYQELDRQISERRITEEQLGALISHWSENDMYEYTHLFDEAVDLADGLFGAGKFASFKMKREIKKKIAKMLDVYLGVS